MVHAERDHAWVHGYLLPELGLPRGAVVTPADFTLGASRVDQVERAVRDARTVVLVLTPAFLHDAWSELAELLATHIEVMGRSGKLVPLTREPCELPLRIKFLVDLNCTRKELWPGAAARLREHLRRDERPPDPERIPCPYPGWSPTARTRPRSSSAGPARSPTSTGGSPSSAW